MVNWMAPVPKSVPNAQIDAIGFSASPADDHDADQDPNIPKKPREYEPICSTSLKLTNCFSNDEFCVYHLQVNRKVLSHLYDDVVAFRKSADYKGDNLKSDLEVKQAVAGTILYNQRMSIDDLLRKIKIDTAPVPLITERINIIQDILRSTLPKTNVPLSRVSYLLCEASFNAIGLPGIVLKLDTFMLEDCIIFLGSDGHGSPQWGEVVSGSDWEGDAFKLTDLFRHIRDRTMGWPGSFVVKTGPTTTRRVNTGIIVSNQIMEHLELPPEMKLHVQGQQAWVRGDKKVNPQYPNQGNTIASQDSAYYDVHPVSGKKDYRAFNEYSNILSPNGDNPMSTVVSKFNLGANHGESEERLTLMLQMNNIISRYNDRTEAPDSTSVPMEKGVQCTLAEQRGWLEEAWLYSHEVQDIKIPVLDYETAFPSTGTGVGKPFKIPESLKRTVNSILQREVPTVLEVTHLWSAHHLLLKWSWDLDWNDLNAKLCSIAGFESSVLDSGSAHVMYTTEFGAKEAIRKLWCVKIG